MRTTLLTLLLTLSCGSRALAQDAVKELAAAVQKLDANLHAPDSAEAKELANNLYKGLKSIRDRSNDNDVKEWQKIQTKADWEKPRGQFRSQRVNEFAKFLLSGYQPPRNPYQRANAHTSKTIAGEGFAIENILCETRPTFLHILKREIPSLWITANLFRPDPVPAKRGPAIVIVHSHHNDKTQGELQDMGIMWAKLGCHVIIPDMLGHGERRDHPFNSDKDYAGSFKVSRQDYYFRYNLGMQLHFIGENLIGWMVNDIQQCVDLLLERPAVDPERVILLGSVAGGGDPAAVAAAVDQRIKCVVPFNFGRAGAEKRDLAEPNANYNYVGGGSWETTRNIRGSVGYGFPPWALVAAAAPRPLIYAHEFAWDAERDPVWKRLQKIYSFYGAEDKLAVIHGKGSVQGKFPDSTHCNNIGAVHRGPMYPILKKWFNIPIPEKENTVRFKSAELRCWTPELVDKLKPKKAYEVMAAIDANNRKGGGNLHVPTGGTFTRQKDEVNVVKKEKLPKNVEAQWLEHVAKDTGFVTTGLLFIPAGEPNEKRMVIGMARRGKEGFLKHRSETIAELLSRGIRVCLLDLAGTGATSPGPNVGRTSSITSLNSLAGVLGTSVATIQYGNLGTMARWLGGQQDFKKGQSLSIALWLDSFAPVNDAKTDLRVPHDAEKLPAISEPMNTSPLMMFAYGQSVGHSVYVRGGFADTASAFEGPFLYLPYDMIVNMDWHTVLQRERVRVEAMVDAQNRLLTMEGLERAFMSTRKDMEVRKANPAYPPRLFEAAVEPSTPTQLAAWFETALKKK